MIDYGLWFTENEFRCQCGCGQANMQQGFVNKLNQLREDLGHPIGITSGFRCSSHNQAVSSTGAHGPHTTGRAADLNLSYERAREALTTISIMFNGVGINQRGDGRFIHVDDLGRRMWTY